ncbi:ribulose-phosphate 3-epimerase [uncultured archaeon]|nr:ribulose-phosphate 3-epimerase [uncultured archaeon]
MLVSPSIISSDLRVLQNQIEECERHGAASFHLDVMDGHFVPNLTMGPDIVKAVRKSTELPLEVHLMIDRPDRYYTKFAESGSDILLIHYESPVNLRGLFNNMKNEGLKYGLVINPGTEFREVSDLLDGTEILLIMSVHPGFSGQKFIDVTDKISEASAFIKDNGLGTKIEVDGGINLETGKKSAKAGADILVSASYIFSGTIKERIGSLKRLTR